MCRSEPPSSPLAGCTCSQPRRRADSEPQSSSTRRWSLSTRIEVHAGDVVGIGIHTSNALRGYAVARQARARGAYVVFGGIHATLFPDEVREHGTPHSVVTGDGDLVWPQVLADCEAGTPAATYAGGRIEGEAFSAARWDLLPADRYMWGSIQTVRGCPKHCSFCSVWRTDGQKPRQRPVSEVVGEAVALRRKGFRFILLADDNFYPVTLADLAAAERRVDKTRAMALMALRQERFELMAQLEQLPDDMVFFTQITMEAAEDPEFLAAMKRARIRGALVGIESVTPEGLKAVHKNFNDAGEALVTRLRAFREQGVHVLGSFIFGLPTDRADTFDATADLGATERRVLRSVRHAHAVSRHGGLREVGAAGGGGPNDQRDSAHPLLADSSIAAPEGLHPASDDVARGHPARDATRLGPFLFVVGDLAAVDVRAFASLASRVPADLEVVPADVRQHRHRHRQRACVAIGTARALARQGRAALVRRRADAGAGRSCRHRHTQGQALCPARRFVG